MAYVCTVIGRLQADPELRYTPSGMAVVKFTVVDSTGKKGADGKWEDGDPNFVNAVAFKQVAENIAESFNKGDRVIIHGRIKGTVWETREGTKRYGQEMAVDDAGPSVKFTAAKSGAMARNQSDAYTEDPWST